MSFFNNNGKDNGGSGGIADEIAWSGVTGKPEKYPPEEHAHDERYSQLKHSHDDKYSSLGHDHDNKYSSVNHSHDGQYSGVNHNHDDRYNTKEDVQEALNFVKSQIEGEQGRVQISEVDTLGYLGSKIDNNTVVVENNELKVKNVEGLTVGAVDISNWLTGTDGNIQTQIDDLSVQVMATVSGMNYRGKAETYAELLQYGNNTQGDLVVVLSDESRGGSRSMYVYREDMVTWEFIGAFTFSDKFTALSDTPASLEGQDGKLLKARGGRVVLENVSYNDLADKPEATVTQISESVKKSHEHVNKALLDTYNQTNENISTAVARAHTHANKGLLDAYTQTDTDLKRAVTQSHTHTNKSAIDRIGINAEGQITIDGVAYVPAPAAKKFLYARAVAGEIPANQTWRWNRTSGGIELLADGRFKLESGKTYHVTMSPSFDAEFKSWKKVAMIDAETRERPPEAPNEAISMAINHNLSESHNGLISLIIAPTSTRYFGFEITLGSTIAFTAKLSGRTSLTIVEL